MLALKTGLQAPPRSSEIDHPAALRVTGGSAAPSRRIQLLSASAYLWAAEKPEVFLALPGTFDKKHDAAGSVPKPGSDVSR